MNQEKFKEIIEGMHEYQGLVSLYLLNSEGDTIFKFGETQLQNHEGKSILKAWKEKESSLNYQQSRYAILKNDDIQLAAKNITGGKGNIAGSITKEGDYLIAHIDQDTDLILLEWSILVNKLAWS